MHAMMNAAAIATTALLAACGTPVAVVQYDLGLTEPGDGPQLRAAIAVAGVTAPAWLDDGAIVYRLAYDDPSRVQSYARSRWVAAPAGLVSQRLRARLGQPEVPAAPGAAAPAPPAAGQGSATHANLLVRVELDEFSQVFDTPQASHVVLRARATLLDPQRNVRLAQHAFEIQRPAPSANANGAVHALREATDAFVGELAVWLNGQ